jgi:hypothetical protein
MLIDARAARFAAMPLPRAMRAFTPRRSQQSAQRYRLINAAATPMSARGHRDAAKMPPPIALQIEARLWRFILPPCFAFFSVAAAATMCSPLVAATHGASAQPR